MRNILWLSMLNLFLFLAVQSAEAVQVNLTEKEVREAVDYGERYSRTIFSSVVVDPACFGPWPAINGGLVRSKFIDLAVKAAMRKAQRQKITEEDIREVVDSGALRVMVRTRRDATISLKQGEKIIEPQDVSYKDACCELCELFDEKADKKNHEFITASFPYSEFNPSRAAIVVVKDADGDTQEYRMSLSKIK